MVVSKIKITNITIYGFGKWIDYSIDLPEQSLVCLYGENESGKSTLQQFILFILFGLPPKKRAFFRPKTSGKMGGRLTISDPEIGEYTIERLDEVNNGAATCYLSNGLEYGNDWLKDQLKGMTNDIYQSIFSFSALDLTDFRTMKDEDLGEILLGIGLTGSNNIYAIEKRLDQKIGNLFKRTGKIPAINQQLDVLDDRLNALTTVKNDEATYQRKQEQMDVLLHKIDELQLTLHEARGKQYMIEKYQRNLSVINDYHLLVDQLSKLPQKHPFPEEGIERLNTFKEQLLPLKSEYAVLEANQKQHKEGYDKRLGELLEVSIYDRAQSVLQKEQQFQQDGQVFAKLEEDIQTLTIKIDTALQDLNVGITLEMLSQISLPFYTETEWKELKEKAVQLQLEKDQLQRDQHTLKKQKYFLSEQLENIKSKLLSQDQQEELHLRLDKYKEYDYFNKATNASIHKQMKWEKTKYQKEKNIKSILLGSVVLGVVIGGVGLLFDQSFLYFFMTIIFIIGLGQWIWGKKAIKETTSLLANDDPIEAPSMKVTNNEKQEAEGLLIQDDENRSIFRSIKDQLKLIDVQYIQWNEKEHTWSQSESKLHQQIDEQLDHYAFLQHIELKHWPDFFRTIKHLLDMLSEKQKMEQQATTQQNKLATYHKKIKGFMELTRKELVHDQLDYQLNEIKDMIEKHDNSQRSLNQYEQIIYETEERKADLKRKIQVYEKEIQELFAISQVKTEDEFYKIEKMNSEIEAIKTKIHQTSHQLQAVFSSLEWQELSKNKPNQDALEIEHQKIMQQCEDIEQELHLKRQGLADLNADVMNMETSEVYSQTLHRFTMEKVALEKLAKKWAVLKVAKEMLVETKRNYRDKYLTSVIGKTSIYFKELTADNYIQVIPPMDDKPFQVETIDRMRYEVNELSQGTIDQLYVCLRLAISEIMSKKHALPFIIDDAFVHFDTPRTKRMMEILSKIAKHQQVIMFTCKEEVRNSLRNSDIILLNE